MRDTKEKVPRFGSGIGEDVCTNAYVAAGEGEMLDSQLEVKAIIFGFDEEYVGASGF
jgi:hypothetical protein